LPDIFTLSTLNINIVFIYSKNIISYPFDVHSMTAHYNFHWL